MAITGISPPSAATYSSLSYTTAPGEATKTSATAGATAAPAQAATSDVSGTMGALSPSVLAALMGQDLKLCGSLAGD